jgi:hypothetical protein
MKDDKKQTFVSRRGKTIGVERVDLTGIDVEHEDPLMSVGDKEKSSSSEKPMATKRRRTRKKFTKRFLYLLAAACLFILLLPIAVGELLRAQYSNGVSVAKKDFTAFVTNDIQPLQKKASIQSDQIGHVTDKVDTITNRMCRGGLLDNMASLYPRASTALKLCKDQQAKYSMLATDLRSIQKQAHYLEEVENVIKPVSVPPTDEFAVISAQQSTWQTANDSLKKLLPPSSLQVIHAELIQHVTGISDNWSKLNTANNAQDSVGFVAAEKALASEYDAVRAVNAKVSTTIQLAQSSVTSGYNQLK